MTREEQILQAARDYVSGVTLSSPSNVIHFEYGVKWADEHPNLASLWHDASEEPEGDCCDIIHQDENGCCWLESKADIMRLYDTWNEFTEVEMIIRWAYVSDLLPKGGEK